MRIANIKTQLVSVITGITDIAEVKWYTMAFESFPAAVIKYRGTETMERGNTMFNEINKFSLHIVYNYDSDQSSESILIDLSEKVIDVIQGNRTLNNTCAYAHISSVEEGVDDEEQKIKEIIFTIEASVRVDV